MKKNRNCSICGYESLWVNGCEDARLILCCSQAERRARVVKNRKHA